MTVRARAASLLWRWLPPLVLLGLLLLGWELAVRLGGDRAVAAAAAERDPRRGDR